MNLFNQMLFHSHYMPLIFAITVTSNMQFLNLKLSGFLLFSLLLLLLLLFFADFKHVTGGWNTYSLDLNLSMFQIWIDEACQI